MTNPDMKVTEAAPTNPEAAVEPEVGELELSSSIVPVIPEEPQNYVKLFPTVKTLPVEFPMADTWKVPDNFYYTRIDTPVAIQLDGSPLIIKLDNVRCARMQLLHKMYMYERYGVDLKVDVKLPFGANLRIKVVAIPSYTRDFANTFDHLVNYPGYDWDVTAEPQMTFGFDWPYPNFVAPVGEDLGFVAFLVTGSAMVMDKTPEPFHLTVSFIPRDVTMAVKKPVDVAAIPPPVPSDINPIYSVVLRPTQVYVENTTDAEKSVLSWIYRLATNVLGPALSITWPGSAFAFTAAMEFIWTAFSLPTERAASILTEIRIAKGTTLTIQEMDGYIGVIVYRGDKASEEKYYLANGDPVAPEAIKWVDPDPGTDIPTLSVPVLTVKNAQWYNSSNITIDWPAEQFADFSELQESYYKFFECHEDGIKDCVFRTPFPDKVNTTEAKYIPDPLFHKKIPVTAFYKTEQSFTLLKSLAMGYFPKGWLIDEQPKGVFNIVSGKDEAQELYPDIVWLMHRRDDTHYVMIMTCATQPLSPVWDLPAQTAAPYDFYAPVYVDQLTGLVSPVSIELENSQSVDNSIGWVMGATTQLLYADLQAKERELVPYDGTLCMRDSSVGNGLEFSSYPKYIPIPKTAPAPETAVGLRVTSISQTKIREEDLEVVVEQGPYGDGNYHQGTDSGFSPVKPLGHTSNTNTAAQIWSPVMINVIFEPGKRTFVKINMPSLNVTGNTQPSQVQFEALRHRYIGPNAKREFLKFRLTSTSNAYANGRLIGAHAPYGIAQDVLEKMTDDELMQFPRFEHEVKGGDTLFTPMWTRPLGVMPAMIQSEDNGTLILFWAEIIVAENSTAPKFSMWALENGCEYSIVVPPYSYVPRGRLITRAIPM